MSDADSVESKMQRTESYPCWKGRDMAESRYIVDLSKDDFREDHGSGTSHITPCSGKNIGQTVWIMLFDL